MSENRNLPAALSILGICLVALGVGLSYYSVSGSSKSWVQPFTGLGVVLALFGVILLLLAFAKMRPKKLIGWRIKTPQIER
jgi:Na+/melibiose symporter-like transporter